MIILKSVALFLIVQNDELFDPFSVPLDNSILIMIMMGFKVRNKICYELSLVNKV